MQLDDAARQDPPNMGEAQGAGVVSGVFAVDSALISLLDLDNLLPPLREAA